MITTQLGISLIEIMISIFLLSILFLGLDAMQMTSLRETKNAYFFTVATNQLGQLAERIKAFNGNQMDELIANWNRQNAEVLPLGQGQVKGNYPNYILTLFWGRKAHIHCDQNTIGKEGCLQLSISI